MNFNIGHNLMKTMSLAAQNAVAPTLLTTHGFQQEANSSLNPHLGTSGASPRCGFDQLPCGRIHCIRAADASLALSPGNTHIILSATPPPPNTTTTTSTSTFLSPPLSFFRRLTTAYFIARSPLHPSSNPPPSVGVFF